MSNCVFVSKRDGNKEREMEKEEKIELEIERKSRMVGYSTAFHCIFKLFLFYKRKQGYIW